MISNVFNQSKSNGEKQSVGIAGFTTFVVLDRSIERTVNVPTNILEDGSVASDHAVVNPIRLTINGNVGDVVLELDTPLSKIISSSSAIDNLQGLYNFNRTPFQSQKIASKAASINDKLNKIDSSVNAIRNVANIFGNKSSSIQAQFSEAMTTLVKTKQLISIETKRGVLENMMITSYVEREDNQSNAINFSITAEEVRITQVEYTDVSQYMKNPANKNQVATNVNKGVQTGEKVSNRSAVFSWIFPA